MAIIGDKTAGLSAFVLTVEAGSFSAASKLLGTTPSAVSKSVARLEQRLGAKLFRRSTRSLTLTVEGTAYYERTVPLLRGLEDAEEVVRSASTARGALRVTMPSELGRILMDALTTDFLPAHPEIRLEVGWADRPVDLIREGYDLALRAGAPVDSELNLRTLGELPMVLVAAPDYLRKIGRPASIEELSSANHLRYILGGRPFLIPFLDGEIIEPEGRLDLDSGFALRAAALNGFGVACLLRCAVEADIRAGKLEVVLPSRPLKRVPLHFLHAFGRTPPLRARLFMDFVAEQIKPFLHDQHQESSDDDREDGRLGD
ncbi:LysR family transcriptional regulator [Sinorhizobium garamanticum]|uniref:LysR family transcriptional regulator n=1 Tax=Sinorhizobium garamanticum TaxID=680247 RepID=A0ABY8DI44_9HYPH|nr:LysR family transcriptional regulator [Sinorhizobium garamanticum]WEX90574.1 LysR family transcriptional regulator [Sinorhizobium garamanticum]